MTARRPERLNHAARELAAPLPPLMVAAERVANTVAAGIHGRRRVGTGEAFWQFRRYMPGDPTTRIDWRRSGRSDHVFVREHEWEAAQTVWLWRDSSASMRYRSPLAAEEKIDRADLLLLALAILLVRGGERIGLVDAEFGPGVGEAQLRRIGAALERAGTARSSPSDRELPRYVRLALIGDFLDPLEDWRALLRHYAGRGVRGHLVQVLDPAEEDLPFEGRARFSGLEGDGDLLVGRVESLAGAYRDRIAARRDALMRLAHAAGWSYTAHRTDRPPHTALMALHAALSGDHDRARPGAAP